MTFNYQNHWYENQFFKILFPKLKCLVNLFLQNVQAFRGCMQGFAINHQEEELISEKAIRHKVGQCFPQVEKGSFFPGDAYAIYSKSLTKKFKLFLKPPLKLKLTVYIIWLMCQTII